MQEISDVSPEEIDETIARAKEIIEKLENELASVTVTSTSSKVIDAIGKVFGHLPNKQGQISITYEMYNKVVELLHTSGQYKGEEYT